LQLSARVPSSSGAVVADGGRLPDLVNFTGERRPVAAHGRVAIASDGTGEDRPYAGVLAPAQAP